jgi:hypothetical protein
VTGYPAEGPVPSPVGHFLPKGGPSWSALLIQTIEIPAPAERRLPQILYEPEGAAEVVGVEDYEAWVLRTMPTVIAGLKAAESNGKGQYCRILVFTPSNRLLWRLLSKIEFHGTVLVLDPRDAKAVKQVANQFFKPVVILMRPYFGSRCFIPNIGAVLCPGVDEQLEFYRPAGRTIATARALSKARVQFMADHVQFRDTSQVRFAFSQNAHNAMAEADKPTFVNGDRLEYYLKACYLEPGTSPFEGAVEQTPLRISNHPNFTFWSLQQLLTMGLIMGSGNGFEPTQDGERLIRIMEETQLGFASSHALAAFFDVPETDQEDEAAEPRTQYLDFFIAMLLTEELEIPFIIFDDEDGPITTAMRQVIQREFVIQPPTHCDPIVSEQALWGGNEYWTHFFGKLLIESGQSSRWPVRPFDIADFSKGLCDMMSAIPRESRRRPVNIETLGRALQPEISTKFALAWQRAHTFNTAYVVPKNCNQQADEDVEVYDICSDRMVRLHPRSMLDLALCQEQVVDGKHSFYIAYSRLIRVTVDGQTSYRIYGSQVIEKQQILNMMTRVDIPHTTPIVEVLGNILRDGPFKPPHNRNLV